MSPRRNRARREEPPERPEGGRGVERIEDGWVVRSVTGESGKSGKTYRCPGCDHEIRPGVPHLVAWRESDAGDRRHWHTPCWQARGRRGPAGARRR